MRVEAEYTLTRTQSLSYEEIEQTQLLDQRATCDQEVDELPLQKCCW